MASYRHDADRPEISGAPSSDVRGLPIAELLWNLIDRGWLPRVTPKQLKVYLSYLRHHNPAENVSFPGDGLIAKEVGWKNVNHVQQTRKQLVGLGLLRPKGASSTAFVVCTPDLGVRPKLGAVTPTLGVAPVPDRDCLIKEEEKKEEDKTEAKRGVGRKKCEHGAIGEQLQIDFPPALNTDEFKKAWREWEEYRREIRKPLRDRSRKMQLDELAPLGAGEAVKTINRSIMNGYQGIFPQENRHGRSTQRSISETLAL